MQKVLVAARLIIADIAKLKTPALATGIAGIAAPAIAALLGVHVTAIELAGDLTVAGGIAGVVQNLLTGRATAALAAKK